MFKKLQHLILAFVFFTATSSAYGGEDEIYTSFFGNAGAGGYDVVAYFTEGMPVEGNDDFTTEYKDAEWHFSSQGNLDKFLADPDRYVPQYGGYCAYAVAINSTASGDPLQWTVLNDKLYLNYDANIQAKWTADRDNYITQADKNWPGVLN